MYFKEDFDSTRLCLFKEGRSDVETKENEKNGVVENNILLIVGGSGSGKSVFANVMATEVKNISSPERTIIYISEKESDELANAFHIYKPTQLYHMNLLKEQNEQVFTYPEKIYHPLTFNIPYKKKLPSSIQWFSFPLPDITSAGFNSLIPSESGLTAEICMNILKEMDEDTTFLDFLWILHQRINEVSEKEILFDKETLIPITTMGDKRTIKNVNMAFRGFVDDFMIHPANSRFNLDYSKICNDSSHIHHLSTKFIQDRKRKIFTIIEFLHGIDIAIKLGKVKRQLVLVFEEMKILLPQGDLNFYQIELLRTLYALFSRIRTKAFIIATAQSYFDINLKFRGLFNKVFLGKLNYNDLRVMIKDFQFRNVDKIKMMSLNVGEFVLWESNRSFEDEMVSEKLAVNVPTYANAEQGEDFFQKYLTEFPASVSENYELYQELKKIKESVHARRENELKQWISETKRSNEAKSLRKDGLVVEARTKIKELKQEKKESLMRQVYDLKNSNQNMSWREIARKVVGINNHITAKNYYNEYQAMQKQKETKGGTNV